MNRQLILLATLTLTLAATALAQDRCQKPNERDCPGRYLGRLSANPYATQAPKLYMPGPGSTVTPGLNTNSLLPRKPKSRDPWDC